MSEHEAAAQSPEPDAAKERRLAAVQAAADAKPAADDPTGGLTGQQIQDATDWFMSSEEEEEGYLDFELNVSNGEKKRWVRFRAGALTRERINEIREQNVTTVTRPDGTEERRQDAIAANGRIAVEGLVRPDLTKPEMRRVRGQDYMDPLDALSARFAHKPGLIDQITGAVIQVSGYNDDDYREVAAGKS